MNTHNIGTNEPGNPGFFTRKLINPLLAFLTQGVKPHQLTLAVVAGMSLGVFPVLGSTTLLTAAAALLFRLNMPAIQIINYFVYPAQLLLFIPYIRLGEWLFNAPPAPLNLQKIFSLIRDDWWGTIQTYWITNVHAIGAWFITALPAAFVCYCILKPLFVRVAGKTQA